MRLPFTRNVLYPLVAVALATPALPLHSADERRAAPRADTAQSAREVRASELLNKEVENRQGDAIGEIEDLVIDIRTGSVPFAVLEYERLLKQQKLFAYPLDAFSGSTDRDKLVLDVDPQTLDEARGFQANRWPAFEEPYWAMVSPRPGGPAAPAAGVQFPQPQASAGASRPPQELARARGQLIGADIHDHDGREVGEIEDLVVERERGRITHALVDVDGKRENMRVPFEALSIRGTNGALRIEPKQADLFR